MEERDELRQPPRQQLDFSCNLHCCTSGEFGHQTEIRAAGDWRGQSGFPLCRLDPTQSRSIPDGIFGRGREVGRRRGSRRIHCVVFVVAHQPEVGVLQTLGGASSHWGVEGGQKAPTLPIASSSSSRSVPVHEFGGGRRGGEEGGEREREEWWSTTIMWVSSQVAEGFIVCFSFSFFSGCNQF